MKFVILSLNFCSSSSSTFFSSISCEFFFSFLNESFIPLSNLKNISSLSSSFGKKRVFLSNAVYFVNFVSNNVTFNGSFLISLRSISRQSLIFCKYILISSCLSSNINISTIQVASVLFCGFASTSSKPSSLLILIFRFFLFSCACSIFLSISLFIREASNLSITI